MKKTILIIAVCLAVLFSIMSAFAESIAVDLDLSVMSGTIVYAQVYNLMYEYETWLGKTIRIAGYYSAFEDTARGVVYHACVIPDATACCAQGIEFIWAGEHDWPDDYPEEGTQIVVTGRLDVYEEDGYLYLHLVDAELEWEGSASE